uniref:Uncharacterized protein n=1 Tax=Panagrellus redivivus TaxID=6233 RepID=A0A7E4W151_PANRE
MLWSKHCQQREQPPEGTTLCFVRCKRAPAQKPLFIRRACFGLQFSPRHTPFEFSGCLSSTANQPCLTRRNVLASSKMTEIQMRTTACQSPG